MGDLYVFYLRKAKKILDNDQQILDYLG